MSETLLLVLKYPNQYSVKFAEKSLAYLNEKNLLSLSDRQSLLENFLQTARQVVFESNNLFYGIDLFKLYLTYNPDAGEVLKDLFWYYCYSKQSQQALLTSKNYYQKSKTLSEKIFSSYQSFYLQMRTSDWLTLTDDYQAYKNLIKTWLAEGAQIQENYLQESFIIVGQPLLYFEDNPKQLRPLQNEIATAYKNTLNQSREISLNIQKSPEKKLKIG